MNRKEWCVFKFLMAIGLIFTLLFLYKRSYCNLSYPVDSEVIGQYGDFIGGAIGTFITLLLLWVTFKLQRKTFDKQEEVSNKNIEMLAIQQLNDKFFKLYDVYKDTLDNLTVTVGDKILSGKLALSLKYNEMRVKYDPPHVLGVRRKSAALAYTDFYSLHKNFAPIYFRIIYHMFEEIEKAEDVKMENRIKYVRLIRSQFTETEVLLIRYNAMTPMGKNSIKFINKYNLLKHMPPMELLEYKEWRKHGNMTTLQANGISSLLLVLKSNMIHALSDGEQDELVSSDGKYEFTVSSSKGYDLIEVVIKRDTTKKLYPNDVQYEGLEKFDLDKLKELLLYFVKDSVVISNFNCFNVRKDLDIVAEVAKQGQIEKIVISVTNKIKRRIMMNYEQYLEAKAA